MEDPEPPDVIKHVLEQSFAVARNLQHMLDVLTYMIVRGVAYAVHFEGASMTFLEKRALI
jgi:hypothetical protein